MHKNLRIVFFGTPGFAAHSLQKIVGAGYNVVAVVTAPDKPAGRGMQLHQSDVKESALRLELPILQPTNLKDPHFLEALQLLKPDLGIVIAFRMLPQTIWSLPELGTFNLHASLLPQYRGAAPINHAIINGETETGVTTFFLKHEIDTGDIVLQQKVAILPTDNAGTLHDKLMTSGANLVLSTLELVEKGNWPEKPQSMQSNLKSAPKIHPEFCRLDNLLSCEEAFNKIRGLSPFPGAWLPDESMKVYAANIAELDNQNSKPGMISLDFTQKKVFWGFAHGALELVEVQPKGKKRMTAKEYLNGEANRKK